MIRAFWTGFMQGLALIGYLLVENARGLLFGAGAVTCYVGIAALSRPVANIVAGVVCMAVGAYPYLRMVKR